MNDQSQTREYQEKVRITVQGPRFSSIAFAGSLLAGNITDRATGEIRAATLDFNGAIDPLIPACSITKAASATGFICGSRGYGEHPFCFNPERGVQLLETPPQSLRASAESVNQAGDVVGSFVDEEGETALLWMDGKLLVLESGCLRATHVSNSRWLAGLHRSGIFRWHASAGYQVLAYSAAVPQTLLECGSVIFRADRLWRWDVSGSVLELNLGELTTGYISASSAKGDLIGYGTCDGSLTSFVADTRGSLMLASTLVPHSRISAIDHEGRLALVSGGADQHVTIFEPISED